MPTLDITRSYAANRSPRVSDLDNIRLGFEVFFNNTKVDASNLDVSALTLAFTAVQARAVIDASQISELDVSSGTDITVQESGFYLVMINGDLGISAANAGFPPGADTSISASQDFIIEINGVSYQTFVQEAAIQYQDPLLRSVTNSCITNYSFYYNFTEGDVISNPYSAITGTTITLLKLAEV